MKKFLFTLVALLAVGSLQAAECRFYVDNFYGQTGAIEVPVKMHLTDYAISAWQVDITLPDGITFDGDEMDAGADMSISYIDSRGRSKNFDSPLMQNIDGNKGSFIAANTINGYYEVDGAWVAYGALKWLPGEYDEMIVLYLNVDENYDGTGSITFTTAVSCGADERPDVTPWVKGTENPYAEESILIGPETPPTPVVAPEPTFDWSDQSFTMEAVCEGHDVVLMIGDEEVSNPYTVNQTYEEQTITFKAYTVAGAGEDENSATVETTVTVPAKALTPSNKPSIVVTPGDDVYTVEATGTGTVTLYLDNGAKAFVDCDNPYEIARPAYGEEPITMTFKASNLDVDPENEVQYEIAWSDAKEVVVPAKDPTTYQTPDPVITVDVDNDNQVVTITATGEGNVTLKVTGANGTVAETSGTGTCSVEIPFGDAVDYVNAYATATATGYDVVTPGDATETMIEIPAKPVTPLEKTGAPSVQATPGDQIYTITCTPNANDPDSKIYISLDGGLTYEEYTEPVVIDEFGTYHVVVYAQADGKDPSNTVEVIVTLDENTQPDPTAVNELNGEKAVAGVRYFNMAGQEMQEANGVTIVVTTYTDGTTSAVKVIK
jgi:hypothetical protein